LQISGFKQLKGIVTDVQRYRKALKKKLQNKEEMQTLIPSD